MSSVASRRADARARLDMESDFVVADGNVRFRQSFETIEDTETFSRAPDEVVEAARRLLTIDVARGLSAIVHDTIVVTIGCSRIPLFAMVCGGRGRTLFSFKCVYSECLAFLDVRTISNADVIKWVLMGVSHNHVFTTFPARIPRNTFTNETKEAIRKMVFENRPCGEIRMKNDVLCNKDVLYNAMRGAREEMRTDQSRALRDAAASSDMWSSEIQLTEDKIFQEAFFVNAHLVSARLRIDHVYIDDTSCTNLFNLPLVSVLCRDDCGTLHCVAWGMTKNRATSSFVRFLTFVSKFFPDIKTFVCDRHCAQRNAIIGVFGENVHVIHCCVHVARNIQTNTGMRSGLVKLFWNMRFTRTQEAEQAFVNSLESLHLAKRSLFTTRLLNTLEAFVPSKVDKILDIDMFPELNALHNFETIGVNFDAPAKRFAYALLDKLKNVGSFQRDVFTLDNTNSIEGYFHGVKSRIPLKTATLLDIFNSVTFTERIALAKNHPAGMSIPPPLVDCLDSVVKREVLHMLSSRGIHSLLNRVVRSVMNILSDVDQSDDEYVIIIQHRISHGQIIDSSSWMPEEWLLSTTKNEPTHEVLMSQTVEEFNPANIMMRIEPLISNVNRSIDVFKQLNDTLETLYTLETGVLPQRCMAVSFSFFTKEFTRFAEEALTNPEVAQVLSELCESMEHVPVKENAICCQQPRRSIIDPEIIKIMGPRTTSTSSKVDHRAPVQRRKMVDNFQVNVLDRKKKPSRTKKATQMFNMQQNWTPPPNLP